MKQIVLMVFALVGIQTNGFMQPYAIPEGVKRIVVLGNSITYSGLYVSYIDAYLTMKYPERNLEIINVGLPSETVSGLSEPGHAGGRFPRPNLHDRLDSVLAQLQPDLVLACYGMNDGIYMPLDEERFSAFKAGIYRLHEAISNRGMAIFHVTPPVYDERKGEAYAAVLQVYSAWLIGMRYSSNWSVIDIHTPMQEYLREQRRLDSSFRYAQDGIHPNDLGHFIMAKHILLSLGEREVEGAHNIQEALPAHKQGHIILSLVEKRQAILKDAWLTQTGHKRPGMHTGLPIMEATQKAAEINEQLRTIIGR